MFRMTIVTILVVFLAITAIACSVNQQPNPMEERPLPPGVKWEPLSPAAWGASTQNFALAVHHIVVMQHHIFVLYSVALAPSVLGSNQPVSLTLLPTTHIATKQQHMNMLRSIPFRSVADINVGMAVFAPYSTGGDILSLSVPGIEIKQPGAVPITAAGNMEIPLLRDLTPAEPGRYESIPGVPERRVGSQIIGEFGGFLGSSPKGEVATLGLEIGNAGAVYLLVNDTGDVKELSAAEYSNILLYLGIPTRIVGPTWTPGSTGTPGPGPTPPPAPGVARSPTPPPPLLPKPMQ